MPANLFRFREFELDRSAYELRRGADSVRLERIPFELLTLLVERQGQLVTREEIIERIWGKDIFHDTENGINTAVRKIRQALHDDPGAPRFVATVPAKGYRFVVPVEIVQSMRLAEPAETGGLADRGSSSVGNNALPGGDPRNGDTFEASAEIPVSPSDPVRITVQKQEGVWSLRKRGWIAAASAMLLVVGLASWHAQPRLPMITNAVRITNDGKAKSPWNPLVTDGLHLYFIEGRPWTTGSGIAQLSVAGGETTWITSTLPEVFTIHDISPDRSQLLVGNGYPKATDSATERSDADTELWVQPLPAGAPHRVGNIYASAACWTPDGLHVLYADEDTVMVANKDGSEPHQLAKVSGIVRSLRFSPDGQRIRFYVSHSRSDSNTIWEMDAAGKEIHPLLQDWKGPPYQCCGNWSPDGEYYYFQAGHGSDQAIWVVPERRSVVKPTAGASRLMSGPLRFSSPVPSNDGKRLFVVGGEPRVELFRYDLRARRFDSFLSGLSVGPVDFSADRKWMAYVTYPDMTLWRSRADGSGKVQLTFPPVRAYEPRWSPDGSKIAYMDVQASRPWKICLVSSSAGSPEILGQAGAEEAEADPTWTPDGGSIVFGKFSATDKANNGIYRLDLKTRSASSIPDSNGLFSPRVSPDGRYISALSNSQTKLLLFDTKTNHWSSLVEGEWVGYNEWSHDGKYIYMRETSAGAGELVRVRIRDRALEHILNLRDFPQTSDIFTGWIGLAPDDAPLLIRDRSVQEIYGLDLNFH